MEALTFGRLDLVRHHPSPAIVDAATELLFTEFHAAHSSRPEFEELLREPVMLPHYEHYALYLPEELVAVTSLFLLDRPTIKLCEFVVAPRFRGQGYARALLTHMEQRALELGGSHLILMPGSKPDAQRRSPQDFYVHLGYAPRGMDYLIKKLPPS